jgi:hypothetical protein
MSSHLHSVESADLLLRFFLPPTATPPTTTSQATPTETSAKAPARATEAVARWVACIIGWRRVGRSVGTIPPVGRAVWSAPSSAPTRHGPPTGWPCSVESWHVISPPSHFARPTHRPIGAPVRAIFQRIVGPCGGLGPGRVWDAGRGASRATTIGGRRGPCALLQRALCRAAWPRPPARHSRLPGSLARRAT